MRILLRTVMAVIMTLDAGGAARMSIDVPAFLGLNGLRVR